jgi:hypothetical protein
LEHSPAQEALAIATFGKALQAAVELPPPPALLPSWQAAELSLPDIYAALRQAALVEI